METEINKIGKVDKALDASIFRKMVEELPHDFSVIHDESDNSYYLSVNNAIEEQEYIVITEEEARYLSEVCHLGMDDTDTYDCEEAKERRKSLQKGETK